MSTVAESTWDPTRALLVTRLRGRVTSGDVARWRRSLDDALARIPDGARFRLISDQYGYEPASLDAHKAMRTVLPELLAAYGLRSALFDIAGAPDVALHRTRGITCTAVAHVHHDAVKMADLDRLAARSDERFFASYAEAEPWIAGLNGSR